MPADNWQRAASPEEAAGLLGDALRTKYLVKDEPCGEPCPSRCSKVTVVREGPYAGAMTIHGDVDHRATEMIRGVIDAALRKAGAL